MMRGRFQRGYTLLEIAIVLTVMLMMSSWLVTSYYNAQQDRRVAETEQTIEAIKEAIADYASSNQTKSFVVINGAAGTVVNWRVPAGRPYLPCPDITGDGVEDRQPLTVPPATGMVTIAAGDDYSDIRASDCYRYKGLVPWRTLNTPPADAWGNRFSYRVDPDFAYSLLGFDQETRASDERNIDLALAVTVLTGGATLVMNTDVLDKDTDIDVATAGNAAVVALWGTSIPSESAPSLICGSAPCSYDSGAGIIVGTVNTSSADEVLQVGGYAFNVPVFATFEEDNIVNGLPVVIVSHGQNGYGAASANQSGALRCNYMPAGHESERQNAYWRGSTANCPAIAPTDTAARSNGFVSRDPSSAVAPGSAEEFDDVVGWMSTEELAAKLARRGVFPVGKLPPIGLEDY